MPRLAKCHSVYNTCGGRQLKGACDNWLPFQVVVVRLQILAEDYLHCQLDEAVIERFGIGVKVHADRQALC